MSMLQLRAYLPLPEPPVLLPYTFPGPIFYAIAPDSKPLALPPVLIGYLEAAYAVLVDSPEPLRSRDIATILNAVDPLLTVAPRAWYLPPLDKALFYGEAIGLLQRHGERAATTWSPLILDKLA